VRRFLHIVIAAVVLFGANVAHAVQPDEVMADPAQEARARALSRELRCMVCQNQSIDDSDAPLARDLRLLIREHLSRGETDAEVMDFVVARYGDFVLLKPRLTARTAILWASPFAVLLLGATMLLRRRRTAATNAAERPLDEAEKALLDKAIR